MERGILFPKANKTIKESQKTFCFADVQKSTLWDGKEQREINSRQAMELDELIQKIILQ
ncbi:MAG: hypothetical protein K2K21_12935 [Lachnospiraceae bacterium]|nr:hypothetical protein [Lachnospiraceae bacterium]